VPLWTYSYCRAGGDRLARLEKEKKDDWTKLPTSKKIHKQRRVIDRLSLQMNNNIVKMHTHGVMCV